MVVLKPDPKILRGSDFIEQACMALGIDPTYVASMTIRATRGMSHVEVEVQRHGTDELLNIAALQPKDANG